MPGADWLQQPFHLSSQDAPEAHCSPHRTHPISSCSRVSQGAVFAVLVAAVSLLFGAAGDIVPAVGAPCRMVR